MRKLKTKKGFTLTELMIAIAFISLLLLTCATVTINMTQTYHKGMTMKAVNTVGLELISELSDAISASNTFNYESYCSLFSTTQTLDGEGNMQPSQRDKCRNDRGQKFIFQEETENIKIKNTATTINDAQLYGIFCSGRYTYVWNTGYTMNTGDGEHSKSSNLYSYSYTDADGNIQNAIPKNFTKTNNNIFRLRKYQDQTRSMCTKSFYETTGGIEQFTDQYTNSINNIDLNSFDEPLVAELISNQDLAIFSLKIDRPLITSSSTSALYTAHLILGSVSGGVIADNSGNPSCNVNTSVSYDVEYCATNKFNFTMKTNGSNNV